MWYPIIIYVRDVTLYPGGKKTKRTKLPSESDPRNTTMVLSFSGIRNLNYLGNIKLNNTESFYLKLANMSMKLYLNSLIKCTEK